MNKQGMTRREFLRTSALGAASLSAVLPACSGKDPIDKLSGGDIEFRHSVASGDPTATSVILWTRITPASPDPATTYKIGVEVAEDAAFTKPIRSTTITTSAAKDFCAKIDIQELTPSSRYWYRFFTADIRSPTGATRTLPDESTATESLKLAVFSCSNLPFGHFHAYAEAAKRSADIDLALHLGDYLYEYPNGSYPSKEHAVRSHEPDGELFSLADYRQRYAQYRLDKDLQAAHASMPFLCVWDDHEIANNTWRTGAQNHGPDEGDFAARVQAAVQAYREWMPIRPAEPAHRIYRSFQFGDLASIYMLDTRYIGRTKQLEYKDYVNEDGSFGYDALRYDLRDPARTILGSEQRAWLKKAASNSRAHWQILGQQVLMGKYVLPSPPILRQMTFSEFQILAGFLQLSSKQPDSPKLAAMRSAHPELLSDSKKMAMAAAAQPIPYNPDAWDGYHREREYVLSLLAKPGAGFLALAGDTHNAWATRLRTDSNQIAGAEFGCQSVTSPGLESFLSMNAEQAQEFEKSLIGTLEDIMYVNAHDRGFMQVTITPDAAEAEWIYVNNVREPDYKLLEQRGATATFTKADRSLSIKRA